LVPSPAPPPEFVRHARRQVHIGSEEHCGGRRVSGAGSRRTTATGGYFQEGFAMSLGTILIIILILILLGVIPSWGYSGSWGYGPSGIVGTILVIVVILLLLGRI
jgi:hypothetical protein